MSQYGLVLITEMRRLSGATNLNPPPEQVAKLLKENEMADKYNGWTNYETWLVKLWMDESGDYWNDVTSDNVAEVSDFIKEQHEEINPVQDVNGVYSDLMSASLSAVNWDEIARSVIEDKETN